MEDLPVNGASVFYLAGWAEVSGNFQLFPRFPGCLPSSHRSNRTLPASESRIRNNSGTAFAGLPGSTIRLP